MNKLLVTRVAIGLAALATPAAAADMDLPVKAGPPPVLFAWTGCYAGAHGGGAWARKEVTDPVQLVQDGFLGPGNTVGVTTVDPKPTGFVVGGQFGCDYQFGGAVVVGVQGAAAGSGLKGTTTVALPLGNPGETAAVTARVDLITSATARLGYAFNRVLLYVDGGAAWAGDKYSAVGVFLGTPFDFEGVDLHGGWTVGVGAEWAMWENWSAFLQYDYYDFGHHSVQMSDAVNVLNGPLDVRQTVQVVKIGLNFHMWSLGD